MFSFNPRLIFLRLASVLIAFVSPLAGMRANAQGEAKLRLICVSSLPGENEIVLASPAENGGLREIGAVELRPSKITGWMSAKAGDMHLASRHDGVLKSTCAVQIPEESRRALVVLVADLETKSYKAHVIDPDKLEFVKGSLLIANFSEKTAVVELGSNKQKIEAGQQAVLKPGHEEDVTYRQMVSYLDENGKEVLCHDRHVPGNADSREMLFILTDKNLGLKIATLPIFGSLD
jgi:hypothetical protein